MWFKAALFSLPFLSKLFKVAQISSFHFEAPLQVAEVVDNFKKRRKVDNRPLCTHCFNRDTLLAIVGWNIRTKRSLIIRRGVVFLNPLFSLDNVTAVSLQAILSKSVDNILSSANKSWQFRQLFDVSLFPIPSSIPSKLVALTPFNNIDKDSQIVSQLRASHDFSLNTLQQIRVLSHYVQKNKILNQNTLFLTRYRYGTVPYDSVPYQYGIKE